MEQLNVAPESVVSACLSWTQWPRSSPPAVQQWFWLFRGPRTLSNCPADYGRFQLRCTDRVVLDPYQQRAQTAPTLPDHPSVHISTNLLEGRTTYIRVCVSSLCFIFPFLLFFKKDIYSAFTLWKKITSLDPLPFFFNGCIRKRTKRKINCAA